MSDTKFTKKAVLLGTAAVALTTSATAMAGTVPNGDFESGLDSWGLEVGGGSAFSHSTTGGNPDGYLVMDNTSAVWGGVAVSTDDPAGSVLGDFGVTAGETINVTWDMKAVSGPGGGGGIKLESWNEGGFMNTPGDQFFATTSDWQSYSYSYTIDPGATRLKIVLLGINADSVMGYDNVCINGCTAAVPVPAAAWLFGSGLLGLFGIARRKKA
jgi:hypothetical protein